MDWITLLIGAGIGTLLAYIVFYLLHKTRSVTKTMYETLAASHQQSQSALALTEERLRDAWQQQDTLAQKLDQRDTALQQWQVQASSLSARHDSLAGQLTTQQTINDQQAQQIATLQDKMQHWGEELSQLRAQKEALHEKLATQKTEMEAIQATAHLQFERIANQIFENKSQQFTETNKLNMEGILQPLKEDINRFKTKVEETYDKESKQRFSLEEKVKELVEQTNKVSSEANNLANALKGQTKKQGNWGEMILESILETSGLVRDREYVVQPSLKNEEGRSLRPDVIVKLPDNRVVIVDSKVSLLAYDRFSATEDPAEQKQYRQEHLQSIYRHIEELSGKQYDYIDNSLDFTMMFFPIEPAYLLAIQSDPELWAYAYERRILLISPTNLIACLKLIADLWKRELQSKNALEIVRRGELLYDKFVNFSHSLEELGRHLNKTQDSYHTAIQQFQSGRGNLVSQALQLKGLGLSSGKKIPQQFLPDVLLPDDDEQAPPAV